MTVISSLQITEVKTDRLLRAATTEWGRVYMQFWTSGKHRGRDKRCGLCNSVIRSGDTRWAPVTHQINRASRICCACMDKAKVPQ